jgi:hypothetical protein
MSLVLRFRFLLSILSALGVNAYFYVVEGVRIVNDSERYMEYAHEIAKANFYQEHNIWYFAYCGFLALFFKFGLGVTSIVFTQITISFLSIVALQKTIENFFKNQLSALVTVLTYVAFVELASWNVYVLTESLFISCICFVLYFWSDYYVSKSNKSLIYMVLMSLIVFWIRPMGVTLVAAMALFFYLEKMHSYLNSWQKVLMISFAMLLVLFLVNEMLTTFHLVENYATGEVVFGISRIPNYQGHEQILLTVPSDVYLPTEGSTLWKAIVFYVKNPIYCSKLFFLKGFFFITHYKPYYSLIHNAYNLLFIIPAYLGLYFFFKSKYLAPIKLSVLAYLAINLLIIMLTCEDWDGRFYMGLVPFVFCFGINILILRFKVSISNRSK